MENIRLDHTKSAKIKKAKIALDDADRDANSEKTAAMDFNSSDT